MYGGVGGRANWALVLGAVGLFAATPAVSADLGGDCCADLEERVAELEATTARKGNRKVIADGLGVGQRGRVLVGRRHRAERLRRHQYDRAVALPVHRRRQDRQGVVGRLHPRDRRSGPSAPTAWNQNSPGSTNSIPTTQTTRSRRSQEHLVASRARHYGRALGRPERIRPTERITRDQPR